MGNNAAPARVGSSKYYFGDKDSQKEMGGNRNPYQKMYSKLDLTIDKSSRTYDKLRGDATREFYLIDRFNKKHIFYIQNGDTINTFFPIHGSQIYTCAKGINNPGDQLRTGCGAEHRWCEASFTNRGDYIDASFVFMEDSSISSKCTDWDNAQRMINNVEKGVDIANKAADTYSKVKGK